jgi:hypothetical protein
MTTRITPTMAAEVARQLRLHPLPHRESRADPNLIKMTTGAGFTDAELVAGAEVERLVREHPQRFAPTATPAGITGSAHGDEGEVNRLAREYSDIVSPAPVPRTELAD